MLQINCGQSLQSYEHVVYANVTCLSPPVAGTSLGDNEEQRPLFSLWRDVHWLGDEPNAVFVFDVSDKDVDPAPGSTSPFDSIDIGFLKDAIAMEKQGNLRGSLSAIYRRVEEMMRESMLDVLDEEITSVPAEEIGTDVLIGLLTATLPVKRKLPSRPQLFRSTLKLLKTRGHFEPGVLDGLE